MAGKWKASGHMEIKKTYNPLTLSHDYRTFENEGLSPNQFIERENIIFTRPVILLVNGCPVLRKNWDIQLKQTDVCHFVELPRGGGGGSNPLQIIAMVAILAAALFVPGALGLTGLTATFTGGLIMMGGSMLVNMFLAPSMSTPAISDYSGGGVKADDVYNLNANRNAVQIGRPFPEHFGRFICYSTLIMPNYTCYDGNNQYLYMIGAIGVGEYDIEGIYIGKKPIENYENVSYGIISPSGTPSICPIVMYTNMVGLELSCEWISIVIMPPGTKTNKIEFDIVYPNGLYEINPVTGDLNHYGMEIMVETRVIDDKGDALTSWTFLCTEILHSSSKTPIRKTYKKTAPNGLNRYEFRIKRVNSKSTDPKIGDTIFLETIRAQGSAHPDYGDVTLLEVKILATDKLNSNDAQKINIIATRKLYPVTTTGFGVTKIASRSIIDACAYIVTSDNGGKQPDSILEFEALADLKSDLATRENYFDYRFTSRTTVMDACATIARCGRAVPYMPGGLFSLVRDKLQTVPTQVYTDDDYTEETLNLDHVIRTDDDATCVEIEYIDPDTWQRESISYYELGGSLENPARLSLTGCTSRQHAYEEAAYMYKDDELNRTAITFTTGLKGHIPKLGDMVYVTSRHVDWGQTGQLAHISTTVATLSEPVDFSEIASEGKLILTSKTGGVLGPYNVTPGDCAHSVTIALSSDDVNTIHANGEKATKFLFGLTLEEMLRVRILKILPASNNEVRIIGSIIHDEVHDEPETLPEDPDPPYLLFEGKVYVYGGYSTSNLQDCDQYTPDTWVSKSDMPLPGRVHLAASTIGDSSYIYGGYSSSALQDCDQYTPDVWTSKTDMPVPTRYGLAASTIGSSGYVYGGWDGTNYFQDCDEYTPDVWTSKTDMPAPGRRRFAASTIGSSGYIYGGYDGSCLQDCDEYTPDTWVNKTNMPLPVRYCLAASTIGSKGYIYGGHDDINNLEDCDEYTPDIWVSQSNMLNPSRHTLAASETDNSNHIYGGYGESNLQDCDQYTPNIWTSRPNMPSPARYGLAASTIGQDPAPPTPPTPDPPPPQPPQPGSDSYIYGGGSPENWLQDCDQYTPDTWVSKTNMPAPGRHLLAASTIGSSGYIYGGYIGHGSPLQDCDEYTPDTWVSKTNMPSPGRCGLAASTIDSSSYIYGGLYGLNQLQDCDQYFPDTWTSKADMPAPRRCDLAASTIGSSGYIYGGGGMLFNTFLQNCDEYTYGEWTSKTDMPSPERLELAASTIGSSSYIYGGYGDYGDLGDLQDCDEYTPDTWVSKTNIPLPDRKGLAASTIENSGYIYGGRSDDTFVFGSGTTINYLQDCDQYTPDTWVSKTDIPLPVRENLAASTI